MELRLRPGPTTPFPTAATTSVTATEPNGATGKDPLCGSSKATYRVMDLDGDGSPDLLVHADVGWKVLRFQAATASSPAKVSWQPVPFPDTALPPHSAALSSPAF